jgi:hypothetical protein
MFTPALTASLLIVAGTPSPGTTSSLAHVTLDNSQEQDLAHAAELLADTGYRQSLLADGPTSGFVNGRFMLGDGGANVLYIRGYAQHRYYANFRDREEETEDSFTHGFQEARVRLRFAGSIYSKKLTYDIQTELARADGAILVDSEIRYTFENKAYVRAGQYKPRFNREEIVIDSSQLAVERSLSNSIFTLGRSQGAGAGWEGSKVNISIDIHEGAANLNQPFDSPREADFATALRTEWMPVGDSFRRYSDFTSWRGSEFTMLLGAAINFETYGETGPGPSTISPDRDVLGLTADVSFEGNGWNAFAAGLFRDVDLQAGSNTSDFGAVVQGGVFVTEQAELFARYDALFPDETTGPDNFHSFAAGVNYYVTPESHTVKLTGDVTYYIDAEADTAFIPAPNTTIGILQDTEGDQVVLRLQLQVMF